MSQSVIIPAKNQDSVKVAQINQTIRSSTRDVTDGSEPSVHVAVVIPAYRVESYIAEVIVRLPGLVRTIIAVDDKSPDGTGELLNRLARTDRRLIVIHHESNQGVGGATKTGYLGALRRGANHRFSELTRGEQGLCRK